MLLATKWGIEPGLSRGNSNIVQIYRVEHQTLPVRFFCDSCGMLQNIYLKLCTGALQTCIYWYDLEKVSDSRRGKFQKPCKNEVKMSIRKSTFKISKEFEWLSHQRSVTYWTISIRKRNSRCLWIVEVNVLNLFNRFLVHIINSNVFFLFWNNFSHWTTAKNFNAIVIIPIYHFRYRFNYSRHSDSGIDDIFLRRQLIVDFQTYFNDSLCLE